MSYSMMGAVGADAFRMVNGIAKPVDEAAMISVKKLQVQLARFEPLKIDGEIGPTTVRIYNKYGGGNGTATASSIAGAITAATAWMMGAADVKGRPPAGPIPPARVRTVQTSQGPVVQDPNPKGQDSMLDTALNFVTSPYTIIAGVGVVGLLFLVKHKKGRAAAPTAITVPKVA